MGVYNDDEKDLVHVMPRASLCTSTFDLRNKMRVGVEPLAL